MALQNRVTPASDIIATPARGTYLGNRGILHNDDKQIVRTSRNTMWLICQLQFKGRKRELMRPGHYTELFFLDEAVALAAGHRPCGECRRPQYRAYLAAVNTGIAEPLSRSTDLDNLLKRSRQEPRPTAAIASLPDGVFVSLGDDDYRLLWDGALHRWSPDGYTDHVAVPDVGAEFATVMTPSLSVSALRHGYQVDVHPSVMNHQKPTAPSPELRDEIERHLRANPVRHGEVFRAMECGLTVDQMGTSRANAQHFKNSVDAMLAGTVPKTKSAAMTNSYGYRYLLGCDLSPELLSHTMAFLRALAGINPEVRVDEPLNIRVLPGNNPAENSAEEPQPSGPRGHLFIINGDLTKVACDAVLVPTDASCRVEAKWDFLVDDHRTEFPRPWDGDTVMPLTKQDGKPHVWLGRVGQPGNHGNFSVFAQAIEDFVAQAATNPVDGRIYEWPLRRLAVNVVGSGEGGGRGTKGKLSYGVVALLTALALEHNVDIILVTYGDRPYAAAQWARRKYLSDTAEAETWPLRDGLLTKAGELAEAAIDRQLVLFIGAGVSAGAGVDTWSGLLENMADKADLTDQERELLKKKDLRDQAALIEAEWRGSSDSFKTRVANHIGKRQRYALAHGLLASLPSKEAVTTNFDTLFEDAATIDGKRIAVLPKDPRQADGRLLLKLHGSVEDPPNMILTRADYRRMPRQYGALMGLVQGLLMMRTMVFVGYSLSDEDFHELIDEVRAARGDTVTAARLGTVLTLHDDSLERKLWKDLDTVPMAVDNEYQDDIPGAARQLELFLDLVGYHATTSAAFFLDESYAHLTEDEAELLRPLQELVKLTAGERQDNIGKQVKQFLASLGAVDESTSGRQRSAE